jgi:ankyrin repeat protein
MDNPETERARLRVGGTPMHVAAVNDHVDMMKWLIEQGSRINAKDGFGNVPMHYMAIHGRTDAMKWLKENGADINAKNNQNERPIHWATVAGHVDAVEWLKANGSEPANLIIGLGVITSGIAFLALTAFRRSKKGKK